MVCCYQVTEVVSSRYGFAGALPARSPRNLGSFADLAVSVFGEVRKILCFLDTLWQDVPMLALLYLPDFL